MRNATSMALPDLERIVRRCEAALQAGTSTHRDVIDLIEAEREMLRRERRRDVAESGSTRTHRTTGGRSQALRL